MNQSWMLKRKSKITKVEEPAVSYNVSKTKQNGIDQSTFDFDAEMERGILGRI
jgi:hypothetical protein